MSGKNCLGELDEVYVCKEDKSSRPDILCLTPNEDDGNSMSLPVESQSLGYSKEEIHNDKDIEEIIPPEDYSLARFLELLSYSNSGDEVSDNNYDRALCRYDVKPEIMSKFRKLLEKFFSEKLDSGVLDCDVTDYELINDYFVSEDLF